MIVAVLQNVGEGLQKQISISSDSETESDSDVVEIVESFVGWIYVGSHNLTPSAWGTLSGSNVNPSLNVRRFSL
jgi:tyrosyl-DNA phosphodiesterase 1